MNIKDKIMRLFGYENIENIHIYYDFIKHPPRAKKMKPRRLYYICLKKLPVPIVIRKSWYRGRWYLIDGYTSYLIAKENNIKYVKVVRV